MLLMQSLLMNAKNKWNFHVFHFSGKKKRKKLHVLYSYENLSFKKDDNFVFKDRFF